jgi:hypothetical protein
MADKEQNYTVSDSQLTANDLLQKQKFYSELFGADFVNKGLNQYGSGFLNVLQREVAANPSILTSLLGTVAQAVPFANSGQFLPEQGIMNRGAVNVKAVPQVDTNIGQFRAGAGKTYIQLPDGRYIETPTMYEAGYRTGLFGGNLDIQGNLIPKSGQMPQSVYNIMARYTKPF